MEERPATLDDSSTSWSSADATDAQSGVDGSLHPLPSSVRRRDVAFIQSDHYFHVLSRLPVHPRREQMTFALLSALASSSSEANDTSGPFGMQLVAPTRATDDQLMRFHAKSYVHALRQSEDNDLSDHERDEFGLVDDAYVFPGLYEYCGLVAGASITAADALRHLMIDWKAELDQGHRTPAPVAINLGGGRHHAMRSQASGFCYVNDVVLCIQHMLSVKDTLPLIRRILAIDIDVHHGDGAQEAFYYNQHVTTLSFHQYEQAFFPGTGGMDEIGAGRGKYHTINVPLRRGLVDHQFEALFDQIVTHAVDCIDPDAIVLTCGVDTLGRDPLGGFNLTGEGITRAVKRVLEFERPLLMLGGGGYSGADACRTLATIVAGVSAPELNVSHLDVPDHDFYEEYGPDFKMTTRPVIHRPNANTDEYLGTLAQAAITTLSKAKDRGKSTDANGPLQTKRKREPESGSAL